MSTSMPVTVTFEADEAQLLDIITKMIQEGDSPQHMNMRGLRGKVAEVFEQYGYNWSNLRDINGDDEDEKSCWEAEETYFRLFGVRPLGSTN